MISNDMNNSQLWLRKQQGTLLFDWLSVDLVIVNCVIDFDPGRKYGQILANQKFADTPT